MSFWKKFIGAEVAQPIDAIGNAFDKLFTSDEERDKAAFVMEKLKQQPAALQVELNKIEAGSRSVFVAGWRPFIGWVCGIGLGFVFIINPIIQWTTGDTGPGMPTGAMLELMLGMLGLGALRTFEKIHGKAK